MDVEGKKCENVKGGGSCGEVKKGKFEYNCSTFTFRNIFKAVLPV